jgi:hypothetical protein
MERNNPLLESDNNMREHIQNGDMPEYSLSDFMMDYISAVSSLAVGVNADRAIHLSQITSTTSLANNVSRVHLQPKAGKHGEPITVIARQQEHAFDKDATALYDYNVFFYEKNGEIIAIFYRKGISGCKTVFLETANNALRNKGMKLEMSLIMPLNQTYNTQGATPSKVSIQWLVPKKKSSDVADELDETDLAEKKEKKEKCIQQVIINLKLAENNVIKAIIERLTGGKIDKQTAFAEIKTKCVVPDNVENFNDAFIQYQIGSRKFTVRFGEIENQIGAYDITNAFNTLDFLNSLISNADNYYQKIAEVQI